MTGQSMEAAEGQSWKDEAVAVEVWKYYASIGGADKDRMVQICTWLLGFSAAILGFEVTAKPTDPRIARLVMVVGVLVSVLAAFVALLYGGYATWNWAIADQIAKAYEWPALLPANIPIPKEVASWSARPALWLARPRPTGLAPIFWLFFVFSLASGFIHLVLLWRFV